MIAIQRVVWKAGVVHNFMTILEDNDSHWQNRIEITQVPVLFTPMIIPETAVPFYQRHEDIRSFLYDPFGNNPPDTYGLELTAKDN